MEFLNLESVSFDNRTLFIFPDGTVEYYLGLRGSFSSPMNLSQFPFDRQTLKIEVDSFLCDKSIMVFVPATNPVRFDISNKEVHEEQTILNDGDCKCYSKDLGSQV